MNKDIPDGVIAAGVLFRAIGKFEDLRIKSVIAKEAEVDDHLWILRD